MESSVQFWIGDWLNYGHRAYERGKYEKALEKLDLEYGTLANLGYVAKQVESSRRREKLSFGHHQTVAPLDPPEQKDWLGKAEKGNWSIAILRKEEKCSLSIEKYPSLKRLVWLGFERRANFT